jgi:hypothetical protein
MAVLRWGAADPPRPVTAGTVVSVSVVAAVAAIPAVVTFEQHGYTDIHATVATTLA